MQNDVSLSINDDKLGIKYGPYKYGTIDSKPRELAFASVGYLMNDMINIRENYIRLGFHLNEFKYYGYYKDFGYETFDDFCVANLGLDKSAVSRCISVWFNFAFVDDNYSRKMWLDEKYKDYSYSQLCEMVSMDVIQRKQITPDMTIKQIREIKKNQSSFSDTLDELYKLTNVSQNVSQVATSQLKEFCFDDYLCKQGIVLFNYIKSISTFRTCNLNIFNQNGKPVYNGLVDFLYDGVGGVYFRLREDLDIIKTE